MAKAPPQAAYTSPLDAGTLAPEIQRECAEAREQGQPWTRIRPLEVYDGPPTHACDGSQGNHHLDCDGKVEAVQYTMSHGEPNYYCEKHALEQNDWDIVHYRSEAKPVPDMSPEWHAEVAKILNKGKKRKHEEPEEIEL